MTMTPSKCRRPYPVPPRGGPSNRRLPASVGFVLAAILACAAAQAGAAKPTSVDDAAFFTAVVQSMRSMTAAWQTSLRADPRPLSDESVVRNEDYLGFTEPRIADVGQDVVNARSVALRQLGVPEADAIAASRCPGAGVILPESERVRLCPPGREFILIVGLPSRRYGVRSSDSSGPVRSESYGYWAMRVLEMEINQHSRSTVVADYLLGLAAGGWRVVKREPLFILE